MSRNYRGRLRTFCMCFWWASVRVDLVRCGRSTVKAPNGSISAFEPGMQQQRRRHGHPGEESGTFEGGTCGLGSGYQIPLPRNITVMHFKVAVDAGTAWSFSGSFS